MSSESLFHQPRRLGNQLSSPLEQGLRSGSANQGVHGAESVPFATTEKEK
jgi:hypothetical protein